MQLITLAKSINVEFPNLIADMLTTQESAGAGAERAAVVGQRSFSILGFRFARTLLCCCGCALSAVSCHNRTVGGALQGTSTSRSMYSSGSSASGRPNAHPVANLVDWSVGAARARWHSGASFCYKHRQYSMYWTVCSRNVAELRCGRLHPQFIVLFQDFLLHCSSRAVLSASQVDLFDDLVSMQKTRACQRENNPIFQRCGDCDDAGRDIPCVPNCHEGAF